MALPVSRGMSQKAQSAFFHRHATAVCSKMIRKCSMSSESDNFSSLTNNIPIFILNSISKTNWKLLATAHTVLFRLESTDNSHSESTILKKNLKYDSYTPYKWNQTYNSNTPLTEFHLFTRTSQKTHQLPNNHVAYNPEKHVLRQKKKFKKKNQASSRSYGFFD